MRFSSILITLSFLAFSFTVSANPKIAAVPFEQVKVLLEHRFTGEVVSREQSVISSELNAKIDSIFFNTGERVAKGQTLFKLDCADYQSKKILNEASQQELAANLKLARLQVTRLKNLEKRQLASTNLLDETVVRTQVLQAQQRSLEEQAKIIDRELARCEVKAPFAAVISQKHVGTGQWVGIGSPILSLFNLDSVQVEVSLPHKQLHLLNLDSVKSEVNGASIDLKLANISNFITPQSPVRKVWFTSRMPLLIGEPMDIVILDRQASFPAEVLVMREGALGVFIVHNQSAKFFAIPDAELGRAARVPEHFPKNALIVVEGQQALQDGDRIDD